MDNSSVIHLAGKPGIHGRENLEKIFQSGNFEQTGKVREFYPEYWENEGILPKILGK